MDGGDFVKGALITFVTLFFIGLITWALIDEIYRRPQAAETANQICQSEGYDFYDRFKRIGILSATPVAIECKYVQNYQEMDIALRQTFGEAD